MPHLLGQLRALSVQNSSWPWEVIVVDNGSSDDSRSRAVELQDALPGLRIVSEPRRGKPHALNRGIAEARGDLILFLDQDDEVTPGYLEEMARALESDELVGARVDLESLNPSWARYQAGQTEALCRRRNCPDYSIGAALGARATVAREIGFSDQVGVSDDIDFCWRALQHGYRLGFVPGAVLKYRQRDEPGKAFRQGFAYGLAEVQMFLRYRDAGHPRPSLRVVLWTLKSLGALALRSASRGSRMRLCFWSGIFAGNIIGSIRWHVVYL